MRKMINIKDLYKCDTCLYNNNKGCSPSIWCENGELYRPNISKLQIVEIEEDISNEPLTYDELFEVAESEEYGSHIWVKELVPPYDVIACITDIYFNEVIAIWAVDEWYSSEYYGVTWVAYLHKPDKDGAKQ